MQTVVAPYLARSPGTMLAGEAVKALLAAPQLARTAHFALHAAPIGPVAKELPTDVAPVPTDSVDNSVRRGTEPLAVAFVVPKRHARRAVTRNLVRRQMREAVRRHASGWRGSLLIRQRGAFAPQRFVSAASVALRDQVRRELDSLFEHAAAAQR
jgi:ribonuclease P protein component